MGVLARLRVLLAVSMSLGVVAIIFAAVGQRLIRLGGTDGQFSGFLSPVVERVGTIIPVLLAGLLLAIILWFLASSVQEERTRTRRRP